MDDAHLLFEWRNDEETRRSSINSQLTTWDEHVSWLARSIISATRILYIAEADLNPVGTIRADKSENGVHELSWTVGPAFRGRGFGKAMVLKFVTEVLGNKLFAATVRKDNVASEKIARALGLSPREKLTENSGYIVWR